MILFKQRIPVKKNSRTVSDIETSDSLKLSPSLAYFSGSKIDKVQISLLNDYQTADQSLVAHKE